MGSPLSSTSNPEKSSKRQRLFNKFFTDFWAEIGDTVIFKNRTKNKDEWRVIEVETDYTKVKWSKGGKTPNFIKLERVHPPTYRGRKDTVWTCSNQLVNVGMK